MFQFEEQVIYHLSLHFTQEPVGVQLEMGSSLLHAFFVSLTGLRVLGVIVLPLCFYQNYE